MGKKTKVLFMLPTLGAGGAERMLITFMNNLDREKFNVAFLSLSDEGPIREWIASDIPFNCFGDRRISNSVFELRTFIKEHKPDVLFTTMVHANALALVMKFFFPKMRVVVREAALPSVLISRYGFKGRLCILPYKLLYWRANLVVSNCSQMIDDFKNRIKISTKNHRILFNPVDTARVYASIPDSFENEPERDKTVHFVAVGRLSFEKGYDRLIKALKANPPETNWQLELIGEGDYRGELESLIKEYSFEDKIILRGYVSNPWEIAAKADCLLLPSRWEGMPNVVLEGFSCGLPAIAMREAGGIMDIKNYCSDEQLKIVDRIEDFVQEMANVKPNPKSSKAESILPDEFLLPHIMKEFEKILEG